MELPLADCFDKLRELLVKHADFLVRKNRHQSQSEGEGKLFKLFTDLNHALSKLFTVLSG